MPTVAEILDYYVNLLIIQYNQKPKMRNTISTIVKNIISENLAFEVRDGFDIETAVGKQLDTIGEYVGIDRFYSGQEFEGKHFAFLTYDDETPDTIQEGFSTYADFETKEGKFLSYSDVVGGSLSLSDDDYRIILKLKILQNNIDHSHKSIDDGLASFFGTSIRADSTGDMTMDYFVPNSLTSIMQVAIEKEVLPRPMGVKLRYLIKEKSTFFGFATYSTIPAFATGFSTYSTFDTDIGEMLTYNKILEV